MRFHRVKGDNLKLSGDRTLAKWLPVKSGGCFFLKQNLKPSENVTIKIDGSGAVDLGLISRNPSDFSTAPLSAAGLQGFTVLNDIKLHKRSCFIRVGINSTGTQLTSRYGEGEYTISVKLDTKYWIMMDAKYGHIEVTLVNSENSNMTHEFYEIYGHNLKILNDKNCITTLRKSPASLCFSEEPLHPGTRLLLRCAHVAQKGTVPGRFYAELKLIFIDPESFTREHEYLFNMTVPNGPDPLWTRLEHFEKEECIGEISVELIGDCVRYRSATGKHNSQLLKNWDGKKRVWLALELYGVEAQISEGTGCSMANGQGLAANGRRQRQSSSSGGKFQAERMQNSIQEEVEYTAAEYTEIQRYQRYGVCPSSSESDYDNLSRSDMGAVCNNLQEKDSTLQQRELGAAASPTAVLRTMSTPSAAKTLQDAKDLSPVSPGARSLPDLSLTEVKTVSSPSPDDTHETSADEVSLGVGIAKNYHEILHSLNLTSLGDRLIPLRIIDIPEYEAMRNKTDKTDACRDLLSFLSKRRVNKADFIRALDGSGHGFLTRLFFPPEENGS